MTDQTQISGLADQFGLGPKIPDPDPQVLRRIASKCGISPAAFERSLAGNRPKQCLTWQGACAHKTPVLKVAGKLLSVRSIIAGPHARPICGNPRCVNRAHILTPLERALRMPEPAKPTAEPDPAEGDILDIREMFESGTSLETLIENYTKELVDRALNRDIMVP